MGNIIAGGAAIKTKPSTNERLAMLRRLDEDHALYARHCLSIIDMQGRKMPLMLNEAQLFAHERIERQLAETGMVRAIILKGRKQGLSTYVGARFYKAVSTNSHRKARVLAHKDDSANELFSMVRMYQEHNPLAPATSASSAKELAFSRLGGGYKVNTAGSEDVGRGGTGQYLHASEFAFWRNAERQMAAIGNIVADVEGTEIIIESTGNGIGNAFHNLWQQAESGVGRYIPIFIPWFWELRYRADPPPDFALSEDDEKYQRAFNLDDRQMAWRQYKIQEYGRGFEWLFDQEFPATPDMAFVTGIGNPFIHPLSVAEAINSTYRSDYGPLIIGVDPAGEGKDRTAIAFRRGRMIFRLETYDGLKPMETAGVCAEILRDHNPTALFIDADGLGAGIADRLRELGFTNAFPVRNGSRANNPERYANKRAECWDRLRAWLDDGPVRIPKNAAMQSDLVGPQQVPPDSGGRLLIEKKDAMKKRGVRSPDCADAMALTFAEAVADVELLAQPWVQSRPYQPATAAGY